MNYYEICIQVKNQISYPLPPIQHEILIQNKYRFFEDVGNEFCTAECKFIHFCRASCTFSNILGANLVRERSHFLYTALQKAHFINLHLQTSICYFSTIWYQKFQTDTHAKKSTQTFTQVNVFC